MTNESIAIKESVDFATPREMVGIRQFGNMGHVDVQMVGVGITKSVSVTVGELLIEDNIVALD